MSQPISKAEMERAIQERTALLAVANDRLSKQAERLRILHEIDRSILAAGLPAEIAQAAAEGVIRITDAIRVHVALWQRQSNYMEILAAAGAALPAAQPGSRIPIRPWPWFLAARAGQVGFEEDLATQPGLLPEAQMALAHGIRSHVVIPLLVGGEPIGHLSLARPKPGRLPDEDLALAQQIADSLAVAMHNARLLESERQARQRLETLQAANGALTQSLDLDTVLETLLDYLGRLIPYDSANVMLLDGEDAVTVRAMSGYGGFTVPALTQRVTFGSAENPLIRDIFSSKSSLLVPDTRSHPGWQRVAGAEHVQSWLAVPLVVGGRLLGLYSVDKAEPGFFKPEHVRLAEALAPQAAVAVQNARLFAEVKTGGEQLQALSRRLVELQEEERRALSRDLHDTSGQSITALKLGLSMLRRAEGCSGAIQSTVDELLQMADTAAEDLHRLAVNLRPSSLDRYGLVPALEQLLVEFHKQTGLAVEFAAPDLDSMSERLPGVVETALYRIVQEALTNVARYADARIVSVLLQDVADGVQVIVEDDGRGFDVDAAMRRGRLGLLGMRERAEMLGGSLEIESGPGQGTSIFVNVPDTQPAAGEELQRPADAWRYAPAIPNAGLGTPSRPGDDRAGAGAAETEPDLSSAAELARAKALSDALVEITAGMVRPTNAEELLEFVLARSAEAIGCDYADIALREGDQWVISHGYRLPDTMIGQRLSDDDLPVAVQVEQTRDVVVTDDPRSSSADAATGEAYRGLSGATIPLVSGGQFLGVVAYTHAAARVPFRPSEVDFLQRLVGLVSLAMENIHLHEVETRQREELAHRVEELQTLLDVLPVGIGIAQDPECRHISVNPAFATMLGLDLNANASLSAVEGEKPTKFSVFRGGRPMAPDELAMQVAAICGQEVRDQVVEVVRTDGPPVTLLEYAVPLRTAAGRPRGSVGVFVDITERERLRTENLQHNTELEAIFSAIPNAVIVYDAEGRVSRMNQVALEMLGYPEETWRLPVGERVGHSVVAFFPDGRPCSREEYVAVRALRGEVLRNEEYIIHLPDHPANDFVGRFSAGPIRGPEGQIAGTVITWTSTGNVSGTQLA